MQLRQAVIADAQDILRWRNDPDTRRLSLTTQEVSFAEHISWLNKCLQNNNCLILIGEFEARVKLGMVRFDVSNQEAVVSINLAPEFRGQGFGSKLLVQSCDYLFDNYARVVFLTAKIKAENVASIKVFKKVGFKRVGDSVPVIMKRLRDDGN